MASANPRFTFENQRMTRTKFLEEALARLQDDVGTILNLVVEHNRNNPRQIGFWASVRLLMPPIEAIARAVGETPWDFLRNHLEVDPSSLAWQMFRHSLTHGDLMRYVEYAGQRVTWGISMSGTGNVIGSNHIGLDVVHIYNRLVNYLNTEIAKNDQTIIDVPVGVIYQNPEQYIIDDFERLR